MKRTERERIERVVGKDKVPEHDHMNAHSCVKGAISYFHPCPSCGSGMKLFRRQEVVNILHHELAKERAWVRRIVKASPIFNAQFDGIWINKAKLLAALSGRKG